MQVFRDITISGAAGVIADVKRRLSACESSSNWTRRELTGVASTVDATCFEYSGPAAPPALVWLTWENVSAEVSNIVPRDAGSLTYDQYNKLALLFAREILTPNLNGLEVEMKEGKDEETIVDLLDAQTAGALTAFSSAANRSTLASHPNDAERWRRFVILSHLGKKRLSPDALMRLLHEDLGWDEGAASDLAIQYEQAIELLRDYDRQVGLP